MAGDLSNLLLRGSLPEPMAVQEMPAPSSRVRFPVLPVAPGDGMRHALDLCLRQGFDIESASDGWVLLRRGEERFILACVSQLR